MKLFNALRNALKIRKERQLPPAGPIPQIGSSIVRERLRMRLTLPLTNQQWAWFTEMGWRTTNMRTDRRQYTLVSESYVKRLLAADAEQRNQLHTRLIRSAETTVN